MLPDADESLIFYGRNTQKDDVLERLDRCHLVSVVGPSGCGKSSLVKAGVIPALEAGLLTRAGYDWLTLQMRPGNDPLKGLATALAGLGGERDRDSGHFEQQIQRVLETERSALWLVMEYLALALAEQATSSKPPRVLLLIDQFEEIFSGTQDKVATDVFVGLIAQFFRKPHPQLYLVLTMRTDFISQCANFPGLAEILNQTQYITPVLRGEDLREAIVRPVEVYHGDIEPELVSAIVADMGAGSSYDADNLPLMQHALLWLWQHSWHTIDGGAPPTPAIIPSGGHRARLTVAAYRENGSLAGILQRHAEEVFEQVRAGGIRRAEIAEVLFRRLSERDASLRYKRSPALASEVCQLAHCAAAELDEVIDPFVGIDASFIERRGRHSDDPLLDLSHESLIRQWGRLRKWADDEADKVATFRRIVGEAESWQKQGSAPAFLKTGGYLTVMEQWWKDNEPTVTWAQRYQLADATHTNLAGCFPLVEAFRTESGKAQQKTVTWRRLRYASAAGVLGITLLVILIYQSLVQEKVRRADMLIAAGESVLHGRSQTLAVNIALDALDPAKKIYFVPEIAEFARHALGQLRESIEIPVDQQFPIADYSADGRWLVTVVDNELRLVDAETGDTIPVPLPDLGPVTTVRWSHAKNRLLLATSGRLVFVLPIDDPNHLRDSIQAAKPVRLGGKEDRFVSNMFSADGEVVATLSIDGSIRLWGAATGEEKKTQGLHAQPFGRSPFALSFDATRVASIQSTGEIEIYDVTDNQVDSHPLRLPKNSSSNTAKSAETTRERQPITLLAFDPSNKDRLLVARGGEPDIWDESTGVLTPLHGEHDQPQRIWQGTFSSDGTRIATASDDGAVRVWSGENGELQFTLREHTGPVVAVRFSPNGQHIASGGFDGFVRIWNLKPALDDPALNLDAQDLVSLGRHNLPKREKRLVELTDDQRCQFGILPIEKCRREDGKDERK